MRRLKSVKEKKDQLGVLRPGNYIMVILLGFLFASYIPDLELMMLSV